MIFLSKPFYVSVMANSIPTINEGEYLAIGYSEKMDRFYVVDDLKQFRQVDDSICKFERFHDQPTTLVAKEAIIHDAKPEGLDVKYPINKRGK